MCMRTGCEVFRLRFSAQDMTSPQLYVNENQPARQSCRPASLAGSQLYGWAGTCLERPGTEFGEFRQSTVGHTLDTLHDPVRDSANVKCLVRPRCLFFDDSTHHDGDAR